MNRNNVFWGVFFVLAAALVALFQFVSFAQFSIWTLIATILLAALTVQGIAWRSFFPVLIPLALLYAIYAAPLGLPAIGIWRLLLIAVLAATGLEMIFHKHLRHDHHWIPRDENAPDGSYTRHRHQRDNASNWFRSDGQDDETHSSLHVSFGQVSKYLRSESLEEGAFSISFGQMDIYFDQAQLSPQGAVVTAECNMGQLNLFIPKTWRVQDNLATVMGHIERGTRSFTPDESAPLLSITGGVRMGEIRIVYV